jgi:hypothetical protein
VTVTRERRCPSPRFLREPTSHVISIRRFKVSSILLERYVKQYRNQRGFVTHYNTSKIGIPEKVERISSPPRRRRIPAASAGEADLAAALCSGGRSS